MIVTNKIECVEVDSKERQPGDRPDLIVESHWKLGNRVVLIFPEGRCVTVPANELIRAIKNVQCLND